MPDLDFKVEGAQPIPFAASPMIGFELRVTNRGIEPIHSILLRCQIQLDVSRRSYSEPEQERLVDLFGTPDLWGRTLKSMLWTHTTAVIPGFAGGATFELPVPCTFDFNVAATKYFAGLEGGAVPLCLLFSGTVFYTDASGPLQVAQIPWEKEAQYRLAVNDWKQMMELYYPNSSWLCLRRDLFDRLYEYKRRAGVPTLEDALTHLLAANETAATRKPKAAEPLRP